MWQNSLEESYSKISELSNNIYQTVASTISHCFNNEIWRSSAITFLSTLAIRREGEHPLTKFARATSITSLQLLNHFLKDKDFVDNDNLVHSSKFALLSYYYSPHRALLVSSVTFTSSYAGFEYLSRNEVDYFQLADHTLDMGVLSGSCFVTYRLLGQIGVTNPLAKFSLSVPVAAIAYYQIANLDNKSYHVLNNVFPVNETSAAYEMFQKFSNETGLNQDISRLAHNTIVLGFAMGLTNNLNSVDGARLAHNILRINNGITYKEFVKLSGKYVAFSLIPTAIQSISLLVLGSKEVDEVAKDYSLKFLNYTGNSGLLTLRDSELTIAQFDEKIVATLNTINSFLFSLSNSLPDLFIGFIALTNYPKIFFPALGTLYTLDYSSAAVNDYLSNNIIRLKKELDLVNAKKDKVTQHDIASGVKIKQDSSISEMRNETWVSIFEEQRDIQTQLHIFEGINARLQYFDKSYVYSLSRSCAQISVVYLIAKGVIKPEETLLYTDGMNQLLEAGSFRYSEKSELDKLSSDTQILFNITSKIEQDSMIPLHISKTVDNEGMPLHIKALSFTRGDANNKVRITMEDLKFEKGHVYAVTGGNGSGKSSFFELLTLDGSNHHLSGFSGLKGEIQTSSQNLTLVSQNPYCPLFITPFQWLVKMTTSELYQLSEEQRKELRDKVLEYSKKLKLLSEGEETSLDSILDVPQDNWYTKLSGGEKIKVELIRQIFLKDKCPDVLLLDEIFGPLDSEIKPVVIKR